MRLGVRRIGDTGDLRREAQAYVWLLDYRGGLSYARIARDAGIGVRAVRDEIRRARSLEPPADPDDPGPPPWVRTIPLFPCASFTPQSSCPHGGPLPDGSRLVCMICHASGFDDA